MSANLAINFKEAAADLKATRHLVQVNEISRGRLEAEIQHLQSRLVAVNAKMEEEEKRIADSKERAEELHKKLREMGTENQRQLSAVKRAQQVEMKLRLKYKTMQDRLDIEKSLPLPVEPEPLLLAPQSTSTPGKWAKYHHKVLRTYQQDELRAAVAQGDEEAALMLEESILYTRFYRQHQRAIHKKKQEQEQRAAKLKKLKEVEDLLHSCTIFADSTQ